ncbi:Thioredoxin reductase 1, cytoplasmic [Strongyloides ratti]|uniref:thioredoxin-disulfide reductase (NADPH) n=1 Tax=Strongyloides ratti TaxID=34506 RepID=A0A090KXI3_STRRB|nr:Thioredoxin reductase 1, cytoplasmic [Strongyloides ratti]CEF62126.1 Thioredoxin reductase 1, cytoplasmic [Strongyloides ratti]
MLRYNFYLQKILKRSFIRCTNNVHTSSSQKNIFSNGNYSLSTLLEFNTFDTGNRNLSRGIKLKNIEMPPPYIPPGTQYAKEVTLVAEEISKKDIVIIGIEHHSLSKFNKLSLFIDEFIKNNNVTDINTKYSVVPEMVMKRIAYAYQRESIDVLVFVKGNCIGTDSDLEKFHDSGLLLKALQPKDYDIIVIGGGSGGLAASKEAAACGKKVAVLDFVKPSPFGTTWGLGGTCVNVGCIPKKLMHQAALLGHSISDARKFGWSVPKDGILLDWVKMKDAIQDHIAGLNWNYKVQLREKDVKYINGYGEITGPYEVTATDKKKKKTVLTADKILISVGLRPKYPDIEGAKEYGITSDDLFSLSYNPGKTLCVGASYVSLECAGFIKGIGNEADVMVRSILLRGFDQDMAERIRKQMTDEGIKFISAVPTKIEEIKPRSDDFPGLYKVYGVGVKDDGSKEEFVGEYNTVLFAIGREAKTFDIGIKNQNVLMNDNGKIVGLNGGEQSVSVPYIYAIGDVLQGCPELTPVAIHAGRCLMRKLFNGTLEITDYDKIPTTVFTPLEYGCCGLAEEDAIKIYGKDNVNVYHNVFTPLEYTVPEKKETKHCYLKLICLKNEHDRVVGFHILSPNAGEITQGFAIALKLNGRKVDFDNLIGIHPTVAESFTTLTILKKEGSDELKQTGC